MRCRLTATVEDQAATPEQEPGEPVGLVVADVVVVVVVREVEVVVVVREVDVVVVVVPPPPLWRMAFLTV